MPGPILNGREYIPDRTKVIKGDGTITYYENLERHEVPEYVIIPSLGEPYIGWNCIRDLTRVGKASGEISIVGNVPIGEKIIEIVDEDKPDRCCNCCALC